MAAYDDIWTWEEIVDGIDGHLPTESVRPGFAHVTLPGDQVTGPRVVHLVMTAEEFADMTVVEGDHFEALVQRVVVALTAMPPQRDYLVASQYTFVASRTMPPSQAELDRARRAGPGGRDPA